MVRKGEFGGGLKGGRLGRPVPCRYEKDLFNMDPIPGLQMYYRASLIISDKLIEGVDSTISIQNT